MEKIKFYLGLNLLVKSFKSRYGEDSISDSFIKAMDEKLDENFFKQTGIRMNKSKGKVIFSTTFFDVDYSIDNNVGTIKGSLTVNNFRVGEVMKWRSNSGIPIHPKDEINEADVEFWFDDLNVEAALREWRSYPPKLGFTPPPLRYSLFVEHFNEDLYFLISFIKNDEEKVKSTVLTLNYLLGAWNEASLAKNRRLGIVHSWIDEKVTPKYLKFNIDFGSAHEKLLKQILESLNDIEGIKEVTITSYPPDEE